MAITTAAPRDSIGSALWNQIANLINGSSGAGQPASLTDIGSAAWIAANTGIAANTLWSLSLRNQGSLGQALRILNTSGTQTVGVTTAAATFALPVVTHDPAGTHLTVYDSTGTDVRFQVTDDDVTLGAGNFTSLGIVRPESYGAVADFQRINGCIITPGTTALYVSGVNPDTNQPANFTSADVGKLIEIDGAGPAGANLITTITAVSDSTHVTIAAATSTDPLGAACTTGTDNTTAFNTMFVALRGPNLHGPIKVLLTGSYMVGNLNMTSMNGVAIGGMGAAPGAGANAANLCPKPGITGNWIDFCGSAYVRWENLNIGRSDQYQWAGGLNVGVLCASFSGQEATAYEFDNCYLDGYYATATLYFDKMNTIEADTCYFYNYYAGARAVEISANNRDNITSAFGTVNPVGDYGVNWQYHFKSCQFNDAAYAKPGYDRTIPTNGFGLGIDGSYSLVFDNCLFLGNSSGVLLADLDLSDANHLSHGISFRNCVWEQPTANAANKEMRTAITLGSNNTFASFVLDACQFRVSSAWIKDNASGGNNTILDRWSIRAPKSYYGTESSIIINNTAAGAGNRIIRSDLDVLDLTITLGGSIDRMTQIMSSGTITATGGSDLSMTRTASAPTFKGSLIAASTILDSAGNVLLTPATRAFVPSTPSGTPVANGIFQQSLVKGYVKFNSAGTISTSYNVTSVTKNGTGDFTVTWALGGASAAALLPLTSVQQDAFLLIRAVDSSSSGAATRVLIVDASDVHTDPTGTVMVAILGLQ